MKFLYACDIHGDKNKYKKLLEILEKENLKYMVWGGDILPKKLGPRKIIQAEFLESGYLENYFKKLEEQNVTCIFIPGNDDLERFDDAINNSCKNTKNAINIDRTNYEIEDLNFIGLSNVLDNPFKSKNRVLMEDGLEMEKQLSNEIWINHDTEVITAEEWERYRETNIEKMKDVLAKIPKPSKDKKNILLFHEPPYGIGLDVCRGGEEAGSKDIIKYIEENNVYMTLHGHIHESPTMSGIWKANIGDTICIQPGQTEICEKEMMYAIIDTDNNTQERFITEV